jgi:hypothetical protein
MYRLVHLIEREARVFIVTLLSLAMTCASLFCFLDDREDDTFLGSAPVASIAYAKSNVRRKRANKYSWSSIEESDSLYLKDSIKTGPDSAAFVRMNKGATLELGENSLFILNNVEDISLSYLRGTVIVRSLTGDKKITVDENGERKVLDLPLRWNQPLPKQQFLISNGDKFEVNFGWTLINPAAFPAEAKLELQIAHESRFKKPQSSLVKAADLKTTANLEVGRYYYRFVSPDEKIVLTEARSFEVKNFEALKILASRSSKEIKTFGESASAFVAWTPREADTQVSHELQFAKDDKFTSLVFSQAISVQTGLAKVEKLALGTYFVRLKSTFKEKVFSSEILKIDVAKATQIDLALLSPKAGSIQELSPEINFTWAPGQEIDGDIRYEIQVKNETAELVKASVFNAFGFVWKNPNMGAFKWKITAFSDKLKIGESSWADLSLYRIVPYALKSPEEHKQINYWKKVPDVKFEWTGGKAAEESKFSSQLEISADADFNKKVITTEVVGEKYELKNHSLKNGKYFWRVVTLDDLGKILRVSQKSDFTIDLYPQLEGPEIGGIALGQTFNLIEVEKLPTVKWTKVADAVAYDVNIASGKTKVRTLASIQDTNYEVNSLANGDYVLTVQAVDPLNRRGKPSNELHFKVTEGKILRAPKLKQPEIK